MQLHVEGHSITLPPTFPPRSYVYMCWGNYPGPHHCDVPFADIVDMLALAKPRPSFSKLPTPVTLTNGRFLKMQNRPMAR